MKTKGFTLIELLAVIVILAIIALIATPIILGIITDARKQANMRSAELYIVAVKQSIARKSLTTEITNTTCTVQSNGNISCTGVSGELEVQMSGNKATEGTIVIERGDVVDVQNLKVNNITYKYDNTRTLVEGTSGEEQQQPTGFTGTIYRNSSEFVFNGGSIVPGTTNVYCIAEGGNNSCADERYGYVNESDCLAVYEGAECVPGTITTGLTNYETEATKSNITEDFYLKHDVVNNIVEASYACIRYTDSVTNELVEVCLQGGDPSYYGDETTGNGKILEDAHTSFSRSLENASCGYSRYSSYSECYSPSLGLNTYSDDGSAGSFDDSGSYCGVNFNGGSFCG